MESKNPVGEREPVIHFLALSGSLRRGSTNTAVLRALAAISPARVQVTVYERLDDLPYFNPDLDREEVTLPAPVREMRTLVGLSDGLLISSPEYAHGVPGVLKNALDWLVSSVEFPGKPVALINVSPRSIFVHASLGEILRTMSASLIDDPAFTISLPRRGMAVSDMRADPVIARSLRAALDAFVDAAMP